MRLQQKLTSKSQGTKPTVGTLKVTVEGERERERERGAGALVLSLQHVQWQVATLIAWP
jgi:hypothetical protein